MNPYEIRLEELRGEKLLLEKELEDTDSDEIREQIRNLDKEILDAKHRAMLLD